MAWSPFVISVSRAGRDIETSRDWFALPCAKFSTMLLPSAVQIGTLPPPPRGAPLSPKTLRPDIPVKLGREIARLGVFHEIDAPRDRAACRN